MNYNHIVLVGRLGIDPEIRYIQTGNTSVARLRLATTRSYKDRDEQWQEDTSWHTVETWGDSAERAARLTKGMVVLVEGELKYDQWTTKDGDKRVTAVIRARNIKRMEKLDRRPTREGPGTYDDDAMPF